MKTNMGLTDRVIRLLVAIALLILYFSNTVSGGWAIAALVVACIMALTAVVGYCPLYTLLGLHTNAAHKAEPHARS